MTDETNWRDRLTGMSSCPEALKWGLRHDSIEAAWAACERGDWMLWLAGRLSGPADDDRRRKLTLAACACARLSLGHVPPGDDRPRLAIEAAEAWARGEEGATLDRIQHAAAASNAFAVSAAYAAAANAAHTAVSAFAAVSAAHAAVSYAAAAASDAAAFANAAAAASAASCAAAYAAASAASAAAAQKQTLLACADIARRFYSTPQEAGW